jgi:CRISPR-associated protein Cas1
LFNFVDSLLRLHGFDTYKGFYHKLFFARKSLSCDLVEPFRPLIDTAVVKMYNLNCINKKDFQFCNGQYVLSPKNYARYSQFFLQCLMDAREDIYNYVHGYYRYVMNDDGSVEFPEYKFRLN